MFDPRALERLLEPLGFGFQIDLEQPVNLDLAPECLERKRRKDQPSRSVAFPEQAFQPIDPVRGLFQPIGEQFRGIARPAGE